MRTGRRLAAARTGVDAAFYSAFCSARHAALCAAVGGALAACAQGPATTPRGDAAAARPSLPDYQVDPSHTFVYWGVVHLGTSTLRGRFERSTATIGFDPGTQRLDLSVSVDIASVSSGVPVLDGLIRGPSMLDAAAYPQAQFTAHGATFEGDVPREIQGELSLHGVSAPLSLHATRWRCGLNPLFLREVCGGDFEGQLERSVFGVRHSVPFVSDRVTLWIQVEAIRQ